MWMSAWRTQGGGDRGNGRDEEVIGITTLMSCDRMDRFDDDNEVDGEHSF